MSQMFPLLFLACIGLVFFGAIVVAVMFFWFLFLVTFETLQDFKQKNNSNAKS